ncbi:MAG: hypothetical protein J2O39_05380 [Acidimicrobiales bacterium]|nr:hypothetical protein [Acidimicrobiales bacterium]
MAAVGSALLRLGPRLFFLSSRYSHATRPLECSHARMERAVSRSNVEQRSAS